MKEILISFIIPVYKVEDYICECVDSIISNTSQYIEILLIDDGSPDSCPIICDNYSAKDKRIITIHQNNCGQSSARNRGLVEAKGKYIAFVDSDDRLATNSIDQMLKWAKSSETDICFMQAKKIYPDGHKCDLGDNVHHNYLRNHIKAECIEYLSSRPKFPASACTKLFNRLFLQRNSICFIEDGRVQEDLFFTRDCIYLAHTYDALECEYYEYRQSREGSTSNSNINKHLSASHMFITESSELFCDGMHSRGVIEKKMMSFVAYSYAMLMLSNKRNKLGDEIFLKKYSWVLNYSNEKKLKIIKIMTKILGINLTSNIIVFVKRLLK